MIPLTLVGDTPIDRLVDEARSEKRDVDSDYKPRTRETKNVEKRKEGNHGEMGKNGPEGKDWRKAVKEALKATGAASTDDLWEELHRNLSGKYHDYNDLVQGMIEWISIK